MKIRDLVIHVKEIPNYLHLLGERGERVTYAIRVSKKRLGIGLNLAKRVEKSVECRR